MFWKQIENIWFVFRVTNVLLCEMDDILNTIFQQEFLTVNSAANCPFDFIWAVSSYSDHTQGK